MASRQDIEDFINSLPEHRQERMRQFQWSIDQQLARHKDPIDRMNKMVELMWEGFNKLKDAFDNPDKLVHPPKADVVELKNKN